jgi:energy-coupling factor transport system permease protein
VTLLLSAGIVPTRAGRLNPVSKLTVMLLFGIPLLISVDMVTAGGLLAAELIALPVLGLGPRRLLVYAWPMALGLAGIWLANLIASGGIGSLAVISVRLVALALPGLLLVLTTEPVTLADALVQLWHLPYRFAYGALAALRMVPLLADDWQSLRRARRARGIDAGRNPIAALRLYGGIVFALLVLAIRRGVRLAAAMDARGFGARRDRTYARVSTLHRRDAIFIAVAAVVAGLVVALSLVTGQWSLLFS